ncbi:MAG: hypothetical protein AABZ23_01040 [Deltaproteobacteria bacterium]
MGLIYRINNLKAGLQLSGLLDIRLKKTAYKEAWIDGGAGLYAHMHRPVEKGGFPGVIIVPGANSPGTDYDRFDFLSAKDIASAGYIVLHYDPSGRGKSPGKEDFWGPRHQKELLGVIRHFSGLPDVEGVRILSFSIGIIIATGALAMEDVEGVKFIFDWEGPSNRFNTTKNDTHEPLKDFPTSDDSFWNQREAQRFIKDIRCGYFRYQAQKDHVQGAYKGHAIELLNNAAKGRALWTRCNDNAPDIMYDAENTDKYAWVPERLNHKAMILKYLLSLK